MTETVIIEPAIRAAQRNLIELAERKGTIDQSRRMGILVALISQAHGESIDLKSGIRNRQMHAHHSIETLQTMRKQLFQDIRKLIPEIEANPKQEAVLRQ